MSRKNFRLVAVLAAILLTSSFLLTLTTPAQAVMITSGPAPMIFRDNTAYPNAKQICLHVSGGSTGDGARIIFAECNVYGTTTHEQWRLFSVGSGNFQIKALHSGKCLDVDNASAISSSSRVQQWTCLGSGQTNQLWKIERTSNISGELHFRLVANTSYCISRATDTVGAFATLKSCSSATEFFPDLAPGIVVQIKSVHSGKCIEVPNASQVEGAALKQNTCGTSFNQIWQVQHANIMQWGFRLVAMHSNKCMQYPGSYGNGQSMTQVTCSSNLSESAYRLQSYGEDRFAIQSDGIYDCIDLDTFGTGGGLQNGARIQQWDCNGWTNQLWRFTLVLPVVS